MITDKQKHWLHNHTLTVGNLYSIPDCSFMLYEKPEYGYGHYVDLPPNKTTEGIFFELGDIGEDFVGGYLKGKYVYFQRHDIECRIVFEIGFLYLFCYLPMIIYNAYRRLKDK